MYCFSIICYFAVTDELLVIDYVNNPSTSVSTNSDHDYVFEELEMDKQG